MYGALEVDTRCKKFVLQKHPEYDHYFDIKHNVRGKEIIVDCENDDYYAGLGLIALTTSGKYNVKTKLFDFLSLQNRETILSSKKGEFIIKNPDFASIMKNQINELELDWIEKSIWPISGVKVKNANEAVEHLVSLL